MIWPTALIRGLKWICFPSTFATSEACGDGDLTNDLGEDLAALGVYGRFVPLRGCPVTMAPHDLTSFTTVMDLFDMMCDRL